MTKLIRFLLGAALVSVLLLGSVPQAQAQCCSCCCGFTPGYWKNHTSEWGTIPTTETLGQAFAITGDFANVTLLEALSFQGGPGVAGASRILFRAAAAALLNATNNTATYTCVTADCLKTDVLQAIGSGNRELILAIATMLDNYNQDCPGIS